MPMELLKSIVLLRKPLFRECLKQRDANKSILVTLSSVCKCWYRQIFNVTKKRQIQQLFNSMNLYNYILRLVLVFKEPPCISPSSPIAVFNIMIVPSNFLYIVHIH